MNQNFNRSMIFLAETLRQLRDKKRMLVFALLIPAVLLSLGEIYIYNLVQSLGDGTQTRTGIALQSTFLTIIKIFIYAVVAVSVHRIIVIGQGSLTSKWGVYFSIRELKYIGWSFLCYAPVYFAALLLPLFTFLLIGQEQSPFSIEMVKYITSLLVAFLGFGLLSIYGMVLPGTAVKGSYSLRQAFQQSKKFRFSLFMALAIAEITVYLAGACLELLINTIQVLNSSLLAHLINSILLFIMGIFGVALLSVAYEFINSNLDRAQNA